MKVYVGPYVSHLGSRQLADRVLRFCFFPEAWRTRVGDWLATTWLETLCEKINAWRIKRRTRVTIHEYDTWNMAETLADIILPMLEQHKQNNHGSPRVDDEDVPVYLRRAAAPPVDESSGDTDELWHFRWQWVLDEIIWAFSQITDPNNEDQFWSREWHEAFEYPDIEVSINYIRSKPESDMFDREGYEAHHARINRGTTLFGKYYRSLWE
jgi:hypothetical protein